MAHLSAPAGFYQLAVLGGPTAAELTTLAETLSLMVADFGLVWGTDITLSDATTVGSRDPSAAFAAAYFAIGRDLDLDVVNTLTMTSAPIIPTVSATGDFSAVPDVLKPTNGLKRRATDPQMTELASAMLECVGLLRPQRRAFVSYRRVEARAAAIQLHDELTARGFDVFLDTHSIKPAEPFQDVLWQRLVDSDVMVMLDTPTYFDSRWTRQEIGRARAKDIQVLRVIWPAHTPTRMTDLSETIYLNAADLSAADGPLSGVVADEVVLRVERLRSRSLASRYMAMTGKLRADVLKIGGEVGAIGAHRAIPLILPNLKRVWAYPIVGVPTAETLNDIADKAQRANQQETPILVYDEIGIREAWSKHLRWLDDQIKSVRAIRVSDAGWTLAAWDDA